MKFIFFETLEQCVGLFKKQKNKNLVIHVKYTFGRQDNYSDSVDFKRVLNILETKTHHFQFSIELKKIYSGIRNLKLITDFLTFVETDSKTIGDTLYKKHETQDETGNCKTTTTYYFLLKSKDWNFVQCVDCKWKVCCSYCEQCPWF